MKGQSTSISAKKAPLYRSTFMQPSRERVLCGMVAPRLTDYAHYRFCDIGWPIREGAAEGESAPRRLLALPVGCSIFVLGLLV
jgi:hypothetical protein